jgi:hypothetical protein
MDNSKFALLLEKIERGQVPTPQIRALLAGSGLDDKQKEQLSYFTCSSCGGKKWSPDWVRVAANLR